jgi:hypothetical protein
VVNNLDNISGCCISQHRDVYIPPLVHFTINYLPTSGGGVLVPPVPLNQWETSCFCIFGSVLVLALAVWGFMFQKIIIGSKSLCLFALFCSVEIDCYRLTRESQRDYNVILSCFYNGLERIATYLGCYLFGAYILVLTFIRCHIFKLIYNNYLLYLFN